MDNRNGAVALPGIGRQLRGYWQNPAVRTVVKVLFLLGVGFIATLGKNASPGWGIPGSSAPLWLAPLIISRAMVRKEGAGTLMGISVAVFGIPVGINNPFFHNIWLYGLTGLALDIAARLPKINITAWHGAIICGVLAHLVKFGFIVEASYFSTNVKHFLLVGFLQSLGLHVAFGIASGLIAWGVYKGYKFARSR